MNKKLNFVDERFELISVIFRLAGNWEYNIGAGGLDGIAYPFTDEEYAQASKCEYTNAYQRKVSKTFRRYAEHDAVKYAKGSGLGYVIPLRFALHTKKDGEGFVFIKNTDSFFDGIPEGEMAKIYLPLLEDMKEKFLPLLNKFYKDTNYAEFYTSHIPYFEELTQKYYDETYRNVDFDWFSKYVDVSNLRCVLSPSNTVTNYGSTINNEIIYCLVRISSGAAAMIHEFNHSFANPIADRWYMEDKAFKKWCEDSINAEKMPYYADGLSMAREYVTRAYDALYKIQHGEDMEQTLTNEKNGLCENAFPYIKEIYEMVLALEK